MDIELILYIIFIVIALLTRLMKGSKDKTEESTPSQSADAPNQPHKKRVSFEELMREFTGEEPAHEKETYGRPYASDRDTARDEYVYDDEAEKYVDDDEVKEAYGKSVSEAKRVKTLDEQVDLSKPITRAHYFKGFEQENENDLAEDILDTLKNPEGARKAIILSEIINRKY